MLIFKKGKSNMFKKSVLSVLSYVAFATVAQAAHLEIVAELSEEQMAAVAKKFVEPYNSDETRNRCFPDLHPLKTMRYTIAKSTERIRKEEAKEIMQAYVEGAKSNNLEEISITPQVPLGQNVYAWTVRNKGEVIDREQVCEVETRLWSPAPETVKNWIKVSKETLKNEPNLSDRMDLDSSLYYAETINYKIGPELPAGADWDAELHTMSKAINFFAKKEAPLTLTFTAFNIRYIKNEEVVFDIPLNLRDNEAQ